MSSEPVVAPAAVDGVAVGVVDGVAVGVVARPVDTAEVAATMGQAAHDGLTVVARGAGTKLDWGVPPTRVDLLVDVSGMRTVLEHVAGDLVVRVQTGVRLSDLDAELAPAGQRLAIDEVVPGSTIGGVISAGLSGPGRLLYGPVRDLLIGVTVVRADGAVTRSGGKVVKNVAGYDLGKLYTGAFGTLGVVTEAIFRLHPRPDRAAWVLAELPDPDAAARAVAAVLDSQVVASAVELFQPAPGDPVTVCVLLEGVASGVTARTGIVSSLCGAGAAVSETPPSWWGAIPGPITVKLTAEPAAVAGVLHAVQAAAAATGLVPQVSGSGGAGVLWLGLTADVDPSAVGRLVEATRSACRAAGGSAVLLRAPAPVRAAVDPWGPVPGLALMRRVKEEFDPQHRLSPGRFVGGI